jgi:hypothetical protein
MKKPVCLTLCSISVIALGAGCATDDVSPDGAMQIVSEGSGTFEATIVVGDDLIAVRSNTEDRVRRTQVTSTDGTSYAEWAMKVDDMNTSGTYGAQSFGTLDDAKTDMDVDLWKGIASSHVGEVLSAVSAAAESLIQEGGHDAAADELLTISRIGPNLQAKATMGEEPAETDQGSECNYWFGVHTVRVCQPWWQGSSLAITTPPYEWCSRTYYVQMYDYDWNLIASDSCPGCQARVLWSTPWCLCKMGKHWDAWFPGSPSWTSDCDG